MIFLADLRYDRIDAPCVFDGPINGIGFMTYVEQAFAKLKRLMRKRTIETTWKRIGTLLDCVKPDACQRYLANARYAST